MKRLFIIGLAAFALLAIVGLSCLYLWIGRAVKSNIEVAQTKYGGNPEDALISYLLDDSNSLRNRTHLAIWTLGQIRSEKAHDILIGLYKNDPEGNTCYRNHDHFLCQYELHKAILATERRQLFSYASLNTN